MFDNQNLWVFKPNDCNRGRGVHVFSKIDDLKKLITDYVIGSTSNELSTRKIVQQDATLPSKEEGSIEQRNSVAAVPNYSLFVVQKYIEKPLLIDERKFDIRLWVLVTQDHSCYLFKEGYIRLSSYKYTVAQEEVQNLQIHLTNNAIQK